MPTATAWTRMKRCDLAAGRAGRAEQADLAHPLSDGHRQRVDDQERAGEERDRGDEGGRRLEVGRRGAEAVAPASAGRREHVRLDQQPRTRARPRPSAGDAPGASAEVDPGHARSGRRRPAPSHRHDDGPPAHVARRAAPARMPTTAHVGRRGGAEHDRPCDPIVRPSSAREALADQGARLVGPVSGPPATRRQVVEPRLGRRVDAEDRHGAGAEPAEPRSRLEVGAPLERRARRPRRPACAAIAATVAGRGRPRRSAATRRSARPTRSATVRSTAASMPRRSRAPRTGPRRRARRRRSSAASGGGARQASPARGDRAAIVAGPTARPGRAGRSAARRSGRRAGRGRSPPGCARRR